MHGLSWSFSKGRYSRDGTPFQNKKTNVPLKKPAKPKKAAFALAGLEPILFDNSNNYGARLRGLLFLA